VVLAAAITPEPAAGRHKTELNPIGQLRRLAAPEQARGAFELGLEPVGTAAGKGRAVTPSAIRCAHDAPPPPRAELAHA